MGVANMKIYVKIGEEEAKFWIYGEESEETALWDIMFSIRIYALALKDCYFDERLVLHYNLPPNEIKVWLETLFGKNVFIFISQEESSMFNVDWQVPACNILTDSEEYEKSKDLSGYNLSECIYEYIHYRDMIEEEWDKGDFIEAGKFLYRLRKHYIFPIYPEAALYRNNWWVFHIFLLRERADDTKIKKIFSALKTVVRWSKLYNVELLADMEDYKVKKMIIAPKQ